ncbi:MAG: hypothetical protein JO053_15285 [Acidobacteria bacterium]|nr:hypothetical protein [Acidobacteriota bacterium]
MANYFFEENVPEPKSRWARPWASMSVRGEIQITTVTWDIMERPDEVVVLFDRASMTIALRPASRTEQNKQPVVKMNRGHRIKATSLLAQFDLEVTETLRFAEVKVNDRGWLILPLGKAVPFFNGTRVGAFHKERKRPRQRKSPVRKRIVELATEHFEEVEPDGSSHHGKKYERQNALDALAESVPMEERLREGRQQKMLERERQRKLKERAERDAIVRIEWEENERRKARLRGDEW